MIDELLSRRLVILFGKGGVGRTTLSAALAWLASRRRGATLAMETDENAPLANLLGAHPSYAPVAAAHNLSVMRLEGRQALEEYLKLVVPRALLATITPSRLFQYFTLAAPGLRELMVLGKVYYEAELGQGGRPHWTNIVFDAAASGHALNLLRMPQAAARSFGDSRVGREARHIAALLHAREHCALLLVTTPEPLALRETRETYQELLRMELSVQAIFLNRYSQLSYTAADLARLRRSPALRGNPHLAYFDALARQQAIRAATARRAVGYLRTQVACPIIELSDLPEFSGRALMARIAAELSSDPGDLHGAAG
ncbi:MAG TPA: ArsA family ATPase [Candidatus Binataceae bacterium]|nr:ArsA family ATPase [Candidatus Binataceae bacterium]